ncbi:MAG: 16S rRNA (cytosine(1402)-N(4))-methyltransferase RsmH [Planctomycetaceae bacterium]|nr:16S rRNA (cytosine(1402)-N(4))-methyltransferase RsmH [Planctomycetaceae bacterium]
MSNVTVHVPVMLGEVIELLDPVSGAVYVDGTIGGGGHTEAIFRKMQMQGTIIGMDADAAAIDRTETRLKKIFDGNCFANSDNPSNPITTNNNTNRIRFVHANYTYLDDALDLLEIDKVDGILLDLGLSSDQLADLERGFSFDSCGKLDLRFDVTEGEPAYALINRLREDDIANLIFKLSDEPYARRIANKIVTYRKTKQIETAIELAEIIRGCVPKQWYKQNDKNRPYNSRAIMIDPATKTFQALRIAVNKELESLEKILKSAPKRLKQNGKIIIISFHSLEDRIVKNAFKENTDLEIITKKPITSSQEELEKNPRARSAKLRCAAKK